MNFKTRPMTEQEMDIKEDMTSLNEMYWDKPNYFIHSERFIPRVFDGLGSPPEGFNTALICVDGQMRSDLMWKEARDQAKEYIQRGYYIFWEIKLGLFDALPMPLTNQTQYLTLTLSLEHFRDTLWKEFKHKSLGLAIYRGSADFSHHFPWDEHQISNLRDWLKDRFTQVDNVSNETGLVFSSFDEVNVANLSGSPQGAQLIRLFCRDVAAEYLALMASRLPDHLPCYALLDVTRINNPLWQAQLLHPERFEQINVAIKGSHLLLPMWGWEQSSSYGILASQQIEIHSSLHSSIGICLPPLELCRLSHYAGLEEALHQLQARQLNFRLIPETHLITEWDGLDYLIYVPTGLTAQGKRKLQGFCAAGGTVITLGTPLGLPYEMSLSDLIETIDKK